MFYSILERCILNWARGYPGKSRIVWNCIKSSRGSQLTSCISARVKTTKRINFDSNERTKRDGIEEAIEIFQKAAGAFNYIRLNFSNAPTADMSASFLNGIVNLMLAQVFEIPYLFGVHTFLRHKKVFSKRKCWADYMKQLLRSLYQLPQRRRKFPRNTN